MHGWGRPTGLWRGKGCAKCRDTGCHGRVGVFELMNVSPELADLIAAGAAHGVLRAQAVRDGMAAMLDDGLAKAGQGITTLDEVLRVAALDPAAEPARAPSAPAGAADASRTAEPVPSRDAALDVDAYRQEMMNWLAR